MIRYPRAIVDRAWKSLDNVERGGGYRVVAASLTHGPVEYPGPMLDVVVVGTPESYFSAPLMRKAVWQVDRLNGLVIRTTELGGLLERLRPSAEDFDCLLCDPLYCSPRYGHPLILNPNLSSLSAKILYQSPDYLRTALKRQRLDGVLQAIRGQDSDATPEHARWLGAATFAAGEITVEMQCVSGDTSIVDPPNPLVQIEPDSIPSKSLLAGRLIPYAQTLAERHFTLWRANFTFTDQRYIRESDIDPIASAWQSAYKELGALVKAAPGLNQMGPLSRGGATVFDSYGTVLPLPRADLAPSHSIEPTSDEEFII